MSRSSEQQNWSNKLAQWEKSGKSAKAWCQENKVIYTTFLGWRNRLRHNSTSPANVETPAASQFIELKEEKQTMSSGISIECTGLLIHLSVEFNPSTLKKCLDTLRGTTC